MSDNERARDEQPDRQPVSVERLLQALQCGDLSAELSMMPWSSNYTFLLSVRHDDITTPAVYKPQQGERPLWDFPDGTLCYRELAAYLTSAELGWNLVPPTVLRDGPRGLGSVQFYIDHDPQENYFSFGPEMEPQLRRLAAFDAIINNADRKGGHCLLDPDGHLWAIDHGISFHTAPKLRTVIWDFAGDAVEADLLDDIERVALALDDDSQPYTQSLQRLLAPAEVNTFRARARQLVRAGHYPYPGSGPNYPWPPV